MSELERELKHLLKNEFNVECEDLKIFPKIMGDFIPYEDIRYLLKNESGEFLVWIKEPNWGDGFLMDEIGLFFLNVEGREGKIPKFNFAYEGDRIDAILTINTHIDSRKIKEENDILIKKVIDAWTEVHRYRILTQED